MTLSDWVTKDEAAALVTGRFFKVSSITVGRWEDIEKRYVGRRVLLSRADIIARAEQLLSGAPRQSRLTDAVKAKGAEAIRTRRAKQTSPSLSE